MRKVLPLLLMVVGLLLVVVAMVQGIGGFARSLNAVGEPWSAPGQITRTLEAGEYVVYEQGSMSTLSAQDVRVTGSGGPVPVTTIMTSTLTLGQTTYTGVAGFTAPTDGTYTIVVAGDGQRMVLGPSVTRTVGTAFLWAGVAGLGGLMILAGLAWLVIGLVLGNRATPGEAQPVVAGAWYPDPEDPAMWRWWDGRQWTDHRQPRVDTR